MPILNIILSSTCSVLNECNTKIDDAKGVIRIRISKMNSQHSAQKKMYKRTKNDLQNIHIKLKIE